MAAAADATPTEAAGAADASASVTERLTLMSGAPLLPLTGRVREKDTLVAGILSVRIQHGFLGMRPWVSRYFVVSHVDLTLRRYGTFDEAKTASKAPKVYRMWGCERIVVQDGGKFKLLFNMGAIHAVAAASVASSKDTELADGVLELNADTPAERQHMTGKAIADFMASEDAAHPVVSALLPAELPPVPNNAHAYTDVHAKAAAPRAVSQADTERTLRRKQSLAVTRQKAVDKVVEAYETAVRAAAEQEAALAKEEERKMARKKSALAATRSKAVLKRGSSSGGSTIDDKELGAEAVEDEDSDKGSDADGASPVLTASTATRAGSTRLSSAQAPEPGSPAMRAAPPSRPKSTSVISTGSVASTSSAGKAPALSETPREATVSTATAESESSDLTPPEATPSRPVSVTIASVEKEEPTAPAPPAAASPDTAAASKPAEAAKLEPVVVPVADPPVDAASKPPAAPAAAASASSSSSSAAAGAASGYSAPVGETAAEKQIRMAASIRRLRARLLMILRFMSGSERSLGRPMTVEEKRARLMRNFKQDNVKRSNQRDNLRADISAMRMGARVTALTDAVKRFQQAHTRAGAAAAGRFVPPAGESKADKAKRIKACMWRIKWCMRLIVSVVRDTERAHGRALTSEERARAIIGHT